MPNSDEIPPQGVPTFEQTAAVAAGGFMRAVILSFAASALAALPAGAAGTTSSDRATVQVELADSGGSVVADGYVALVPEDMPWHRPVQETRLHQTNRVTWAVAPGIYRVVAGAPGRELAWRPAIELRAGTVTAERIELRSLLEVHGEVYDEGGIPIEGATVATYMDLLPFGHLTLSQLGRESLAANGPVRTDAAGRYTLRLPLSNILVIVQKEGHRPAPMHVKAWTSPDLGPTVLHRSGRLTVTWPSAPQGDPSRVFLEPLAVELPRELPRTFAERLWERPLVGTAATWTSLIPGRYRLRVGSTDAVLAPDAAPAVGEVVVPADRDVEMRVELPEWPRASLPPNPPAVLIDRKPHELNGLTVEHWKDGKGAPVPRRTTAVAGGTRIDLGVPCEAGGTFVVRTPSLLAAAEGVCGAASKISLRRRVRVAAAFSSPRPQKETVGYASCATGGAVPFPIGWRSASHFDVPGECGDASVLIEPFIPIVITSRQLSSSGNIDLGRVELREGGTLTLVLRSAPTAAPLRGVEVIAWRQAELESISGALSTEGLHPLRRQRTDAAGHAALTGLPFDDQLIVGVVRGPHRWPEFLGTWALRPGEAHEEVVELAPLASAPITLSGTPESSLRLETLALQRVDGIWPKGAFGEIRIGDERRELREIPAGTWRVRALVRLAPYGVMTSADERTITLLPGINPEVQLEVRQQVFRGRVVGTEPVSEGILTLRGRGEARRADTTRLDAGGAFAVLVLPGDYEVDLQLHDRFVRLAKPISFTRADQEVVIELPSGSVSGRVQDEEGVPVAGVTVRAQLEQQPRGAESAVRSAADGSFALSGMSGGRWILRAESQAASSEPLVLEVSEGAAVHDLALVVAEKTVFTIGVVSAAGARVDNYDAVAEVLPIDPATTAEVAVGRAVADGRTEFRVRKKRSNGLANVMVAAADGTLACASANIATGSGFTVRLPYSTGAVRLTRTDGPWSVVSAPRLVSESGCWLPVPTRNSAGPSVTLGRVPAGRWWYVEAGWPAAAPFLASGRAREIAPSIEINVPAGATATVAVPSR